MSKPLAVDEFKQLDASWIEGTTDPNTAALARGLGSVYLRKGNYPTVPSELYVKLGGGAAGKGWAKQNLVNLGVYNILNFGAVADGVTDCRAAILAAVTAANAAGGGMVYIPAAAPGYAVHVNPSGALSGCIELNNVHNISFVGDGYNSWLKMAGDYLGHTQFLFHVWNGSTAISFFNFRCNGASIVNPNNVDQNHYIQVSSDTTDAAGPPSNVDVRRMWFDPIVGSALRVLGEASAGGRRVSDVRFLYNAVNVGDGANLGRSCVEANRNSSRIQLHYNWMAPVSPVQAGQNIDFEPANSSAPDRWSILGNIIVSVNAFSVTLSGVDSPRDPSIRNMFSNNVVIGTVKGGTIEAVAQPTLLTMNGNVVTTAGVQPNPSGIVTIRNLTEAVVVGNVFVSLDNGGTHDRLGFWLFDDPPGNPAVLTIADNLFEVVSLSADSTIKFDTCNQIVCADNMIFVDGTANPNGGIAMRPIATPGQDWICKANLVLAYAGQFTQGILIECAGSNSINNVLCAHNLTGPSVNGILWDSTGFAFNGWRSCNGNITEGATSQAIALPATLVGVTQEGTAGQNAQVSLSGAIPTGHVSASPGSFCMNTAGAVGTVLSIKESGTGTAGWVDDGPDELVFGVETLNATTTSQFIAPGFALPTETAVQIKVPIPRAGTIRSARMKCTAGVGGGNNVYTVQRNGVDTSLTLTIANTGTTAVGNGALPAFVAGDLISIRTNKTLAPGTPQSNVVLTLEITS